MSGPIMVSLCFWVLLTADLSPINLGVGLLASVAVAFIPRHKISAISIIITAFRASIRLPLAIGQAVWIMILPHRHQRFYSMTIHEPGNAWKVFEAIFLITLTPKSLAVSEEFEGKVEVHQLERKSDS